MTRVVRGCFAILHLFPFVGVLGNVNSRVFRSGASGSSAAVNTIYSVLF